MAQTEDNGAVPGAAGAPEERPQAEEANVPDVQEELEQLRAELARAQEEARNHLERLARAQADFENFRRRAQREREELALYANQGLLKDFLPVLDNLERALAAGEAATAESLRAGVDLTARQFRTLLEKHGVTPVEAVGQPFDPNVHEAVMQEPGDYEVPTVVLELQKGYKIGDRLLRPAMVKVARKDV